MAFSQSNSRGNTIYIFFFFFCGSCARSLSTLIVELQNRKILEELQLKKQMLLKQGVAPTLSTSLAVTPTGSPSNLVNIYFLYSYKYINIYFLCNQLINYKFAF